MEIIVLYFWCVASQSGFIFYGTHSVTQEDAVVKFVLDPPADALPGVGDVTWQHASSKGYHLQRIEVRSVSKHHTNNKWMAFEKGNIPIFNSLSNHSELDAIGRYVRWRQAARAPIAVDFRDKRSYWDVHKDAGVRILPVAIENAPEFTEGAAGLKPEDNVDGVQIKPNTEGGFIPTK